MGESDLLALGTLNCLVLWFSIAVPLCFSAVGGKTGTHKGDTLRTVLHAQDPKARVEKATHLPNLQILDSTD